ncbi:hypothetical protein HY224_01935 [Candidatus Uhrbacteria bacterium]|nr:hypothetical protein [Candidatus Uhrbacteria bacterium]
MPQNFKMLSDEDLCDLLFTSHDQLPRPIADEIIARSERLVQPLWSIIKDEHNWGCDSDFWSAVHASYLLGAIGGERVITPLIMSLRLSHFYDIDWIFEALPSVFGSLGQKVIEPLKKVVLDRSNDWFIRTIALEGIAASTIKDSKYGDQVFDFVAMTMKDQTEDIDLRGMAGSILVDFCQKRYLNSLLDFVEEEEEVMNQSGDFLGHFGGDKNFVLGELEKGPDLNDYVKKWLSFYNEEEIVLRQKRWKRESAWWYPLSLRWGLFKFRRAMRKKLLSK